MGEIVDLQTNPAAATAEEEEHQSHDRRIDQPLDPIVLPPIQPLDPIVLTPLTSTSQPSLNAMDSVVASDYDNSGSSPGETLNDGSGAVNTENIENTAVSTAVSASVSAAATAASAANANTGNTENIVTLTPAALKSSVSGSTSSSSASPNSNHIVVVINNRNSTSTDFARKRPNSFANSGPGASSSNAVVAGSGPSAVVGSAKNYQIVAAGSPNSFDSSILRTRNNGATSTTTRSGSNGNLNAADKRRNTITGMPIAGILPLMPLMPVMPISASDGDLGGSAAAAAAAEQPPLTTVNNNFAIISSAAASSPMPPKRDNSGSRRFGGSMRRKKKDAGSDSEDDFVKVGTRVDKGHVNFVQMYDMLTGIRTSVSRCEAKPDRPLVPEDFQSAHKLAFDITGNELTPSSRYDFKFKDYAPWVFRQIRKHFHIDPAEYLISLTGKYVLSELGSPGKSGSFFYFSRDYRFIIKTIHHKFVIL